MQELSIFSKFRLLIIGIIIYSFSVILTVVLIYYQLFKESEFAKRASENKTQYLIVPASRSIIFDRSGKNKLAYNRRSMSITVIPSMLPEKNYEKEQVFQNISELINMPVEDIKKIIKEQAYDKNTKVVIKYDIDNATMVRFFEKEELYTGFMCENLPRRVYTLKEKSSLLLGYTGVISKEEYRSLKNNPEYYSGAIVGKFGIEKQYDELIRGKTGIMQREVDAKGNIKKMEIIKEPVSGDYMILSIDKDLQELAYNLMGEDKKGAIVVSKPATGEILALVSKPAFDPQIFTDRYSREEFYNVKSDIDKPFYNRAIQGTYPPASTFKLLSGAAILDSGISEDKTTFCQGFLKIGNRIFKCWGVHGKQDFIGGLAMSCDVYFYTMGLQAGREEIAKIALEFGINKKTGIDLPNENVGLFPEMTWFTNRYRRPWNRGDTANISIGQGDLLVTPLGLNTMTCMIANDGIAYKPHLLKEIVNINDNSIKKTIKPEILRSSTLSKKNFELIKAGMYEVTTKGTARWVRNASNVPIAGKTGTGEAGKEKETHALFTAYAPYNWTNDNDVIAVTVVIEHGGGGSGVAAPIAVNIIDYYFKYKNPINFPKRQF